MSSSGALAALPSLNPRAEASRINGAKSRGPKTALGKARSSRNALKHGLCAETFVAFGDEDQEAFEALEAALVEELAPQGVLQRLLVGRIARAAWRLERAERMEGELFGYHCGIDATFGLGLVRDGHGARAFDTLLRYRGGATAELWRALRTLKALQAEARSEGSEVQAEVVAADVIEMPAVANQSGPTPPLLEREQPKKPKGRANPRDFTRSPTLNEPDMRPDADKLEPYTAPQARRASASRARRLA
jgi:hypothetical protein